MSSKYTNIKLIDEEPSKFRKLLKLTLVLLAAIGAILIIYAVIHSVMGSKQSTQVPTIEIQDPHGTLAELTAPETFMEAYLAVNCDETLLKETQTVHVTGTIEHENSQQTFRLSKKRPNMMRFMVDRGDLEMTIFVNSDEVWRRMRAPSHEDLVSGIDGAEAAAWRTQGRFFGRIISAHLGEGRITGIEITQWNETECLKVSTEDATGRQTDILIDPETMYPLAEQEITTSGQLKESVMADYRNIDGMPLPFTIESFLDGQSQGLVRLDSAQLNTGLLSPLFERPKNP